jgi:hypothetical protein
VAERAAPWRTAAFIPFGPGRQDLGFKRFRESVNSQPSSFAVAPDGSYWIVDRWKARVAHYTSTGRFLGSLDGLVDRGEDVVVSTGRVAVLARQGVLEGAVIASSGPDGRWIRTPVVDQGRPVALGGLVPARDGPVGQVLGFAATPEDGPHGIARLDAPGSGQLRLLPGVPLRDGSYADLQTTGDQTFDLRLADGLQIRVQPVGLNLAIRAGSGRRIPAEVEAVDVVPADRDVLIYVRIAPARSADASRFGDSRWLLRLGRSPILWERLPDPRIPDEPQRRHLAVGPDGSILLMVPTVKGMRILRRP